MTLSEHIEAWRERRARERELNRISREDMDGYGLDLAEYLTLAHMPSERFARMEEMARINGLDLAKLDRDPTLSIAVRLTCSYCGEQRQCRKTLAAGAGRAETDFCPNAETYRMLAAE